VLIGNTYRQIEEEEAFLDDMFSHGVRGIIVAACDIEKAHFARAAEQGMVMVNYDGRMPVCAQSDHFALDSVSMDNIDAGRMAAEHLIAQGCRRLAFATVEGMTPSRAHKIEGFLRAVQDHGLYREGIVEGRAMAAYGDTEMTESRAGAGVKNQPAAGVPGWHRRDQRCAGHWADGWSASGRIHVPEQISIVGIDNIPLSGLVFPGLTSIMPPLGRWQK
jgi:DNA-binding LacI/PurR family transcriptional regulator